MEVRNSKTPKITGFREVSYMTYQPLNITYNLNTIMSDIIDIIHIFQYFHITTDLFIIDSDYYNYICPIENIYSYYYS